MKSLYLHLVCDYSDSKIKAYIIKLKLEIKKLGIYNHTVCACVCVHWRQKTKFTGILGYGNQALCSLPATNKSGLLMFLFLLGGEHHLFFICGLKTGSYFQELWV